MRRTVLVALLAAAVAMPAGAAVMAKWRVIGSASAQGSFPIAAANGEVKKPLALRVRALGSGTARMSIVFSCSQDAQLRPSQTVTLAIRRADSCNVVASGSNDGGSLTVKIEAFK